jgi:hypothetical protein
MFVDVRCRLFATPGAPLLQLDHVIASHNFELGDGGTPIIPKIVPAAAAQQFSP